MPVIFADITFASAKTGLENEKANIMASSLVFMLSSFMNDFDAPQVRILFTSSRTIELFEKKFETGFHNYFTDEKNFITLTNGDRSPKFERMKYSIEQVVKKTGVSAFSLRNWEKRYQFLHPKRLNNGFRYYDETDVSLLKRVRELMEEGARIGDLAERIRKGEALPEPQANQRRDEATRGTEELYDFLKEGEVQKAIASWEKLQAWVPVTRQVEWVLAALYLRASSERDAGTLSMFEFQAVLSFVRSYLTTLILAPLAEPHHFKEGHRKTALFSVLRTPEQISTESHQRAETALAFRAWKARERGRAVHFVEGGISPADVRGFLDRHEGVEAYLSAEPRFRGLLNGYGRSIHWVSPRVDRLEQLLGMDGEPTATGVTPAPLSAQVPAPAAAQEEGPDTMAG